MVGDVWVYTDFRDTDNLSLIGKAQSLACAYGHQAAAVCPTVSINRQLLFHSGADIIFDLPVQGSDYLKAYALACLCQTYQPGILLFPATVEYSAIAARTAAQLGTGLTADCIGLTADEQGLLLQTRPAFGGGLIADIICRNKRPQMATVHSGVFPVPVPDPKRTGQHITYTPPLLPHDPSQLLSRQLIPNMKDMRDGQIIVAGGKGVGSREGFKLLAELAQRIGGLLGASRSAVDAGYCSYDSQIGQTGITVSPDVYLAFGISGSPQHVAGMNSSGKVIAVNIDAKAPIFDYADIAIVDDWKVIAQGMIDAL